MSSSVNEISGSLEDYLETIFRILGNSAVARVRDIADKMEVNPASVTPAMKRLAEMELVEYSKRNYITLTERGLSEARRIYTRHRLLSKFLSEVLGADPQDADSDACSMEHHLSDGSVERLAAFFEFLGQCPEMQAILKRGFCRSLEGNNHSGSVCPFVRSITGTVQHGMPSLTDCGTGRSFKVARISSEGEDRLALIDMGFIQGSNVSVVRPGRNELPWIVELEGHRLTLSGELAGCILVEADGTECEVTS
jgi:DtxR family transcriptional regulator, Mn-dependent transcriptional regulator